MTRVGMGGNRRMGLNVRQEAFLAHYLSDANFNGYEAARLAGYEGNYDTLRTSASEILAKPYIKERLQELMTEHGINPAEIIFRLSEIARGNLEDFVEFDEESGVWTIDIRKAKKRGKLYALETLKRNRYGIEIKLTDRISALEKLAKIHGMLGTQDINVTNVQVNVLTDDERQQRIAELLERAQLRKAITAAEETEGEVIDITLD